MWHGYSYSDVFGGGLAFQPRCFEYIGRVKSSASCRENSLWNTFGSELKTYPFVVCRSRASCLLDDTAMHPGWLHNNRHILLLTQHLAPPGHEKTFIINPSSSEACPWPTVTCWSIMLGRPFLLFLLFAQNMIIFRNWEAPGGSHFFQLLGAGLTV